jgi:ectoine hydroxylase-related dioxygenase (phytanoyl-CoA dioxygenase family)
VSGGGGAIVEDGAAAGAVAHFRRVGWVHVRPAGAAALAERLRAWADEVERWGDPPAATRGAPRPWLRYREMTDHGPATCRTEGLVDHHDGLRRLLCGGDLVATAGALLGEPAVLYKDKLNHKHPGGAGYAPHQDAPAYRFVDAHVSCMVAIDDATPGNGCLEVVSGAHDRLWPTDDAGCLRADVVAALAWAPVPVRAGDTLWFHSRTPHRSGPNRTDRPRRALYPTYNARAEGDLRDEYYARKAAELAAATGPGDRVPVSLIGDFQGRPVR